MKKLVMTTMVCGSLLLGGCATNSDGVPTVDQAKLDALVASVQEYTKQACTFLPTAASVIDVIGAYAGTPGIGTTVSVVGTAICNGFVTRQAGVGGSVVRNVNTPKGLIKVYGTRVK